MPQLSANAVPRFNGAHVLVVGDSGIHGVPGAPAVGKVVYALYVVVVAVVEYRMGNPPARVPPPPPAAWCTAISTITGRSPSHVNDVVSV